MLFPSLVGPTAVFELGKKGTHLRDPSENPSIAASGSLGPLRFRSYEECRSLSSIPSCSLGATYDVALLEVEECGFHRRATINVLELSETPPLGPAAHLRKECHVGMGGTITLGGATYCATFDHGGFLVGPLILPVARLGV
ncbi:hypothetical protein BHE74_00004697 [Ensete ventricosum]|nr:hypothetical protein BHE74_00004697 [Ensete ventricosum]